MQAVKAVHWASNATDPPNLRSHLLFPASYKDSSLHAHPEGLYAVSHEVGLQKGSHFARFTIYGNQQQASPDHYQHAAEQIVSISPPGSSLKGQAIPSAAVSPLTEVLCVRGWRATYNEPTYQYTCSPDVVRDDVVAAAVAGLPPGHQLSTLTEADAPLVDSLWTYSWDRSQAYVQQLIASNNTSCIRLEDGSPVAWFLEVEPLCGGMLHVLEGHRRKGLAKVVVLDLFCKLQEKWQQYQKHPDVAAVVGEPVGHGVYCYVVAGNDNSKLLMEKLGLHQAGAFSWVGFDKSA